MRNFDVIECAQRSPEWFAARCGRLTASRAADMLATIKSGEAAARRDLRIALALERVTGQPEESGYINADMQRGIDLEPAACAAYEALTGNIVTATGFLSMRDLMAGCSLDGHLGDFDVVVSIKCPKKATHFKYLREQGVPADYVPQMLHELFVTGAKEYHFLSFDDRFPDRLQTVFRIVKRHDAAVADYEKKARAFLVEVDNEQAALVAMADPLSAMREVVAR